MARTQAKAREAEPFSTINTTPMIDIMLVLLIMMILSLPAPTHKVPIDLPVAGASDGPPPPVHQLGIDGNGALSWDGAPLAGAMLDTKLAGLVSDPAKPVLHLSTAEDARYERFDAVLAQVKAAGITRVGFVGNPAGY